jgi:hypothetical protein
MFDVQTSKWQTSKGLEKTNRAGSSSRRVRRERTLGWLNRVAALPMMRAREDSGKRQQEQQGFNNASGLRCAVRRLVGESWMRQFQRATGRFRKGTTTKECLREPESRDGWTRKAASVEMLRGCQKKNVQPFFSVQGGLERAKKKNTQSCDGQGNVKADPLYDQIRAGTEKRRMKDDERCYKPDVTMPWRRCKKPRFHSGRCTETPLCDRRRQRRHRRRHRWTGIVE